MQEPTFHALFLADIRRRLFDESWPRIEKCLHLLSEAEVWERPNPASNSAGNLVLHVCGNARQWIVSGLGGQADTRQRSSEFSERGPLPKQHLFDLLGQLKPDIVEVLDVLSPEDLLKAYTIQGFQENGISVLIHVAEHLSYHTGQISYLVKARKDLDLHYYAGHNLETSNTP
ncbi:MAG: DinB family protein [Haliscomenobacter sp.]